MYGFRIRNLFILRLKVVIQVFSDLVTTGSRHAGQPRPRVRVWIKLDNFRRNVLVRGKTQQVLEVLDVLDRHPQRLYLGHPLAGWLDQGQPGAQLREGLVSILHPRPLSVTSRLLVLLPLLHILKSM